MAVIFTSMVSSLKKGKADFWTMESNKNKPVSITVFRA
jgi:hypothetical protein